MSAAPKTPPAAAADDSEFLSATFKSDIAGQGVGMLASNSVATRAQVRAVLADFDKLSPKPSSARGLAFALANACCDQGSSMKMRLEGLFDDQIDLMDAAAIVKRHCASLRQFNMFYAKAVWNYRVDKRKPPAGWMRAGYTDANKYAAFDFFDGVTRPEAAEPQGGLSRQPTLAEIQAHRLNAYAAIDRSRRSEVFSTRAQPTYQQQIAQYAPPPRPAIEF